MKTNKSTLLAIRHWQKRHPEKLREYARKWRKKNPEKWREYSREWRTNNPEKVKEFNRKWRLKNGFKWRIEKECKLCKKIFLPHHHAQLYCNRKCQWKNNSNTKSGGILKLRFQILLRDNFTCQYCGRKPPETTLEVDHFLVPESKGGKLEKNNLITSCKECNRGKGDILLISYFALQLGKIVNRAKRKSKFSEHSDRTKIALS